MYKLIVVDDEPIALKGIEEFLRNSDCGFDVSGAFLSVKDAVEFLKKNDVELVITDIKMPEISGTDFVDYLKTSFRKRLYRF